MPLVEWERELLGARKDDVAILWVRKSHTEQQFVKALVM